MLNKFILIMKWFAGIAFVLFLAIALPVILWMQVLASESEEVSLMVIIFTVIYTLILLASYTLAAIRFPIVFQSLDSKQGEFYTLVKENIVGLKTANPNFWLNDPDSPIYEAINEYYKSQGKYLPDWDRVPMEAVKFILEQTGTPYRAYKNWVIDAIKAIAGYDYCGNFLFGSFNIEKPVPVNITGIKLEVKNAPTAEDKSRNIAKIYVNAPAEIVCSPRNAMWLLRFTEGFEGIVKSKAPDAVASALKDTIAKYTYIDIENAPSEDALSEFNKKVLNLAVFGNEAGTAPAKNERSPSILYAAGVDIDEINRWPIQGADPNSVDALTISSKIQAEEGRTILAGKEYLTAEKKADTKAMETRKAAKAEADGIKLLKKETAAFHNKMKQVLGSDYQEWARTEAAKNLKSGAVYAPSFGGENNSGGKISVVGFQQQPQNN